MKEVQNETAGRKESEAKKRKSNPVLGVCSLHVSSFTLPLIPRIDANETAAVVAVATAAVARNDKRLQPKCEKKEQ